MKAMVAVIMASLTLLLGISGANFFLDRVEPRGFEYAVGHIPDNRLKSELDSLGAKGWRVVSARRAAVDDNEFAYELIMVRKR